MYRELHAVQKEGQVNSTSSVETKWNRLIPTAQFAITINSNVCLLIRVLNTLMRESYA